MTEAMPRPWRVDEIDDGAWLMADDRTIADMALFVGAGEGRANAALIVEAVNSHDAAKKLALVVAELLDYCQYRDKHDKDVDPLAVIEYLTRPLAAYHASKG